MTNHVCQSILFLSLLTLVPAQAGWPYAASTRVAAALSSPKPAATMPVAAPGADDGPRQVPDKTKPSKEETRPAVLKVGDRAPVLKASKWLQGNEVTAFRPGHVYVIEFWATWCGPCIASMPHTAELQAQYQDKGVTFIAYTVRDPDNTEERVTAFVKKRGVNLKFAFAYGDDRSTYDAWITAAGKNAIPYAFVVDRTGRIAYIGHPIYLGVVLPKVVAGDKEPQEVSEEMAKVEEEFRAVANVTLARNPRSALKRLASFEAKYPAMANTFPLVRTKLSYLPTFGKPGEAREFAEAMVTKAIQQGDPTALGMVSSILRLGDGKDDKQLLAVAVKAAEAEVQMADGKDARALINLAETYFVAGNKVDAQEYVEKAIAATAESPELKQRIEQRATLLQDEKHLLYVAAPGIRNDLALGGAGILVFDIENGHRFVKRIPTPASEIGKPENIKGICASARNGKLYFTTLTHLYCLDLRSEQPVWDRQLPGGCDRLSINWGGTLLFVPTLEGPYWNIVSAQTGEVTGRIETGSGSHNTICSPDGSEVYLAGLKSPLLSVLDTDTQKVIRKVGPFSAAIRPFTVNASGTRCFVNVNGLLGFEVGDLKTGKVLERVEVQNFHAGPTKRHGCPSHGIGLTPDEKEIWLCDAANSRMHVFDVARIPPRQIASIPVREQPGWVTFSLDGRFAYPSTGDVIDTCSKKILTGLQDEHGRQVHSEKLLEIDFRGGAPIRTGDQFGLGRAKD